ncbi:3-deoxy-manno-octulosonate cytidylyltransferase [Thalassotalea litorea]|uniref:3-deoxy-manno-octulosonate cytidylyltransferase n=1 Tax=Thalassotalea litorea TaxID=2020715 RepID=A0A5R9ISK4_9GAMM|nr:3-deoxy-manno-octulosonate cytidylyltransferase [Thalassotalea litorea]TLU67619.1 3-deoxy-manno-octulosonate cytidylyltransferase [Thalassotalea litorea]
MGFTVVIPARYESSRLPGKVLAEIEGKPMIAWVAEKALASGADRVIVATDHPLVMEAVAKLSVEICETRADHQSGTERLAEVVEKYQFSSDEIIVNVQGDEPFIPSENIAQVAKNLENQSLARMATLAVEINSIEEVFNPNAVKVVLDKQGYALYFSRAGIPFDRDEFTQGQNIKPQLRSEFLRHLGIYAYRAGFIKDYISWQSSEIEKIEALEQLRVLWYGEKIHVEVAKSHLPVEGVDTPEDLEKARAYAKQLAG